MQKARRKDPHVEFDTLLDETTIPEISEDTGSWPVEADSVGFPEPFGEDEVFQRLPPAEDLPTMLRPPKPVIDAPEAPTLPGLDESPPQPLYEPAEPKDFQAAGLTRALVEHLALKYVLTHPGQTGNEIAAALALHPGPVRQLLRDLKHRMLVVHATGNVPADFHYDLTEAGRAQALDLLRQNAYVGPAPVTLAQYRESIDRQSITLETPSLRALEQAFAELVVDPLVFETLGPAMTSGRGLFLFGNPGNGKTSIALRMIRAYRDTVYLPHAVLMNGTMVQVYDPQVHQAVQIRHKHPDKRRLDKRWVECHRPVVVAGGELTLESLELEKLGPGTCEAPLQVKANCGILVIDDFGRQRVEPSAMLNRWILPLESRVDYLRLPSGRTVQVPFDAMLVFSTNLDPKALVDEAFIRRIPYKIHFPDPDTDAFRAVLTREAEVMGFPAEPEMVEYIIERFYLHTGRGMRYCHPRDLLLQVRNRCLFLKLPLELSPEALDLAARAYFTLL